MASCVVPHSCWKYGTLCIGGETGSSVSADAARIGALIRVHRWSVVGDCAAPAACGARKSGRNVTSAGHSGAATCIVIPRLLVLEARHVQARGGAPFANRASCALGVEVPTRNSSSVPSSGTRVVALVKPGAIAPDATTFAHFVWTRAVDVLSRATLHACVWLR